MGVCLVRCDLAVLAVGLVVRGLGASLPEAALLSGSLWRFFLDFGVCMSGRFDSDWTSAYCCDGVGACRCLGALFLRWAVGLSDAMFAVRDVLSMSRGRGDGYGDNWLATDMERGE